MKRFFLLTSLLCTFGLAQAQPQSPTMVQFLKEFPLRASFNTHSY